MRIGYARVSTTDQNLERQLVKLKAAGCEKIFEEKMSGAVLERPALRQMIDYIREGDVVVVTELDRLGRSNADLTFIMDEIRGKKAGFEFLNLPSLAGVQDDNIRTLLNSIIIELYKYMAQSERERIRERQRQGIELAKKAGKFKGRKALFSEDSPRLALAFEQYERGKSAREVCELTGIKVSTFFRYLKRYGKERKSGAFMS